MNMIINLKKIRIYFLLSLLFVMAQEVVGNNNETVATPRHSETLVLELNEKGEHFVEIKNTTATQQNYNVELLNPNEVVSTINILEPKFQLSVGASRKVLISTEVSDRIPAGAMETCEIRISSENTDEIVALATVRAKQHPFLLVTNDLLQEAKEKIKKQEWAKENFDAMLQEVDNYQFPKQKIITKPRPTKVWSSLNYKPNDSEAAFKLAIAYRLTNEHKYIDKLIPFIKVLSDPKEGYLSVGAATTGVMVHEGNFFLFLSATLDLIYDDERLSQEDKTNIRAILQHYLKENRKHMSSLGIMNHQASANAGAILVALFLQDHNEVDYLVEAPGGMADQIGKGVMDDGWWFESTVNYCYLVTQRYCLVAQAFKNYGKGDLFHRRFPTKYKSKDFDNVKNDFTGMKFENWGPITQATRGIEDMIACYIPMMDQHGEVIASNDSNRTLPDDYYEIAYREFRIPELAWVLNKTPRDAWVSLVYGVSELPKVEDPRTMSAFMPNVGLVALRSQNEVQTEETQIQAYQKWGTHGGWHGHFDRTALLAIDRNNHNYFGTEMAWFGYGNAGYKECVQTSATHNMVVVDELQQESLPSEQLLFYAGAKMQVSAVQTKARWREIPQFNLQKFPPWDDAEYASDFHPILQRRMTVVTDDYIVIADYMESDQEHNYDWLMHPIGFQDLSNAKAKGKVLNKVSENSKSPFKYFTNGQWYTSKKERKATFDDHGNKFDIYSLWPKKAEVLVANYPVGGKQKGERNNPNRNTISFRVKAEKTKFVNVIEAFKGETKLKSIESEHENEVTIQLTDGRIHKLIFTNFYSDATKPRVELIEYQSDDLKTIERTL